MRRDARRREEKPAWWKNNKIIVSGSIIVIALAFGIGVSIFSDTGNNNLVRDNRINSDQIISLAPEEEIDSKTESASSSIGNRVDESQATNDVNTNNAVNTNEKGTNNIATNTTVQNRESVQNATNNTEAAITTSSNSEENKELAFAWPVKGEILKAFSGDSLLYSSTLKEWVVHNGIDIRADKTSVVSAAADGTVKSIKNDPRYGLTVVIEHANGFKTVYSNLLTAEFVVEGEKVEQGQSIGTVGNTANFEVADDSHLHFEIMQGSEYMDPTIYLK